MTVKFNGSETTSGSAGTYTVVITIETNYTGEKREATIEIICGTDKITVTVTQEGTTKGGEKPGPIELKSPISSNTTLKALGLPVDYVFKGSGYIQVTGNTTLTIEPGVTIMFDYSNNSGGFNITSNATIKAVGTADKRIRFIGAKDAPGAWEGITIVSNTDNQFAYCDFLNMGTSQRIDYGGIQMNNGAKAGFSYCKFTNGKGTGIRITNYGGNCQLSAFNNNVFEGYVNYPPMHVQPITLIEKMDMTSDFTKNTKQYVEVNPDNVSKEMTINQTTVPYYFNSRIGYWDYTLTINEGVTIYFAEHFAASTTYTGKLMVNGTATKKVKFTRLPGTSTHWGILATEALQGSELNHCIFEYGGNTGGSTSGVIHINGTTRPSNVTLNNVEINNCLNYGVTIGGCTYTLRHSNVTFSGNTKGNVWDACSGQVRTHFP
jgi:hypothetical protein